MTSRLAALAATLGLTLTLLVAAAPSASAAWKTQHTFHGAKVQLCKARMSGGWRVKVRLDNRNGKHVHHGAVGRDRNGIYDGVEVRAAAGRVSGVKSVTYRRGDDLLWGGGEGEGINFGDGTTIGRITVC
jgi:hypothetical protein